MVRCGVVVMVQCDRFRVLQCHAVMMHWYDVVWCGVVYGVVCGDN